eukprot:TRINITY_DN402_c0_g1_i7.p1 TRINITY_DN402_c0_g1~~TRINITY_DN402_c0_g1_i7.p1  ORF type:complete len:135 (-),score=29.21 TRINITY_DN402_c0_g1_i7:505-909(-)
MLPGKGKLEMWYWKSSDTLGTWLASHEAKSDKPVVALPSFLDYKVSSRQEIMMEVRALPRRKGSKSDEQQDILEGWWEEHTDADTLDYTRTYIGKAEKLELSKLAGLSLTHMDYWLWEKRKKAKQAGWTGIMPR